MDFKCYICAQDLSDLNLMINHLKIIHAIKDNAQKIKCVVKNKNNEICGQFCPTFRLLKTHMKKCTFNTIDESINSPKHDNQDSNDTRIDNSIPQISEEPTNLTLQSPFSIEPTQAVCTPVEAAEFVFGSETHDHCLDELIDTFVGETISLNLSYKSTDAIFNIYEKLILNIKKYINEAPGEPNNATNFVMERLIRRFHEMSTQQKRRKFFEKKENFVGSEVKAIGLRSEMVKDRDSKISLPTTKQSKFQYVPISKKLIALFGQNHFRQLYMNYNTISRSEFNQMDKHICQKDKYVAYCCGEVYRKSELFSNHPESIQIQLFIDGFELCDPLKSKANVHKQMAIYFSILNLPHQLAYSQNNIHLVALCYSNDLKTKETDYNNLWNEVVKDIAFIEKMGIIVDSKTTLKGNENTTKDFFKW